MRKAIVIAGGVVLVLFVGVGAVEYHAAVHAVTRAVVAATPAAQGLGFDLREFEGPTSTGSHFWGTESFHWERKGSQGEVELLQLLPADGQLCWSSLSHGTLRNHGCVRAES